MEPRQNCVLLDGEGVERILVSMNQFGKAASGRPGGLAWIYGSGPASPASLSGTLDRRLGGSLRPDKYASRHRASREPRGSSGRSRYDGYNHRLHKQFFSPTDETNDPGSRIPEDTQQRVLRREARRVIKVPESFMFSHEKFIALIFDPLQARKTAKIKGCLRF